MIKTLGVRWLAVVLGIVTILGNSNFITESIVSDQWQSDRFFFAFSGMLLACAILVAAFFRPYISFVLCWVYLVVMLLEILAVFSGYSWNGFASVPAQEGPLTLRLINRVWSYHPIMLFLALAILFLSRKSK